MTSVHKHPVAELIYVEEGSIRVLHGKNPKTLKETTVREGESIFLHPWKYHACGCQKPAKNRHYALAVEYVIGPNKKGKYTIERARAAVPSKAKPHGNR
jgi:quercetin dioxygenase-like cupin family protein